MVDRTNYATQADVEELTTELKPKNPTSDTTRYDATITLAMSHADKKINSKLRKSGVPIPAFSSFSGIDGDDPLNDLIEAGNLLAGSFMFDTYYSASDAITPTSKSFKDDANELIDNYVENYIENQYTSDGEEIGIGIFAIYNEDQMELDAEEDEE